ncbi:hypothetical protein NL108_016443 [Boleophthalmus pectinirostris]|nr:hypothetical protein NL108_016443 [Boleophthalmus pectinirostris]
MNRYRLGGKKKKRTKNVPHWSSLHCPGPSENMDGLRLSAPLNDTGCSSVGSSSIMPSPTKPSMLCVSTSLCAVCLHVYSGHSERTTLAPVSQNPAPCPHARDRILGQNCVSMCACYIV